MTTCIPAAALALSVFLCGPAVAASGPETVVAERGVDGLARVPFRAINRTAGPIACAASLAHWHFAEIGDAAPGGSVDADLWSDPATGAVFILNAKAERMPVLSLWCGRRGAAASTRSDVWLARRKGAEEPAVALVCLEPEAGAARPVCRREGAD